MDDEDRGAERVPPDPVVHAEITAYVVQVQAQNVQLRELLAAREKAAAASSRVWMGLDVVLVVLLVLSEVARLNG